MNGKVPETSTLVSVGDVVVSPKFAHGIRMRNEPLIVGVDPERMMDALAHFKDKDPTFVSDPQRGTAEFVVTRVEELERSVHLWAVTARRLNRDGTYDPEGEIIAFSQSGSRGPKLPRSFGHIASVTVAGRMRLVVNFERIAD